MVGDQTVATLTLRLTRWSPTVAADMARLPECDPTISPDWFRAQIEAGGLKALTAESDDGEHVGTVLVRTEAGDLGKEFVIVAAAGSYEGLDLTAAILPALERLARDEGCVTVRVHTMRPGLVRKLGRMGYATSEIVMRRVIAHVQ